MNIPGEQTQNKPDYAPIFNQRENYKFRDITDTPRKYDALIDRYQSIRPQPDDFADKKMFSQESIERDNQTVEEKKQYHDKDEEEVDAGALESMLYYMTQQGQLLEGAFSEPSSEYDDYLHATDLIIGIPRPTFKRDAVASIDATTTTNYNGTTNPIVRKFQHAREKGCRTKDRKVVIPYTTRIDYYSHGSSKTKLSRIPHYTLGVSPQYIQRLVDQFNLPANGIDISNIPNPHVQAKLLTELYYQGRAGYYSCQLAEYDAETPESISAIKQAAGMHKEFADHASKELQRLLGVEDPKKLADAIFKFFKSEIQLSDGKDPTFLGITNESLRALNTAIKDLKERRTAANAANIAQAAKHTSGVLQGGNPKPATA